MATAPPFATASQRPPLPPRLPSPRPAFVSSPPAASQTALPPSARTSIVHVPSRSQSSSTETSPSRALAAFTVATAAGLPWFRRDPNPAPERGSLRPSLPAVAPSSAASCSAADCLSPRGCRSRLSFAVVTCPLFRRNTFSLVGSVDGRLGDRRKLATVISWEQHQPHVARVIAQLDALPAAADVDPIDVAPPLAIARYRDLDRASSSSQPAHLAQAPLQTKIEPEPGFFRVGLGRPHRFGIFIVGDYASRAHRGAGRCARSPAASGRPVRRGRRRRADRRAGHHRGGRRQLSDSPGMDRCRADRAAPAVGSNRSPAGRAVTVRSAAACARRIGLGTRIVPPSKSGDDHRGHDERYRRSPRSGVGGPLSHAGVSK